MPSNVQTFQPTKPNVTSANVWRRLVAGATVLFASLLGGTTLATLAAYDHWLTTGLICYRRTLLAIVLALGTIAGLTLVTAAWRRLARASRCTAASARMLARPLPPSLQTTVTELGLDGHVTYFEAPVASAFVAGFRRPHIFVSSGLVSQLTEEECKAVLRHEARHLACGDPWRQAFAQTLQATLPRGSALSRLCQQFRLAIEFDADAAATVEPGDRWHLTSALIKALRAGASVRPDAGRLGAGDVSGAVASLEGMAYWRLARLTGRPLPNDFASPGRGQLAARLLLFAAMTVLWWCPTVMGALPLFL